MTNRNDYLLYKKINSKICKKSIAGDDKKMDLWAALSVYTKMICGTACVVFRCT